MKLKIFIIAVVMIVSAGMAVAADENELNSSSFNYNYLTTGSDNGEIQRSEIVGNTHITSTASPITITHEYNSVVYTDHSYQKDILEYFLEGDDLKKYTIERPLFVKKTTRSASKAIRKMDKKCDVVYAFRDKAHLKSYTNDGIVVGYIDTFVGKNDDETLMCCMDQAIIDTGGFGGNVFLMLSYNFMIGNNSTTVGLGGSAATGVLGGSQQASSYTTAIGYASNTTLPKTFSYIHGIALYSPAVAAMEAW